MFELFGEARKEIETSLTDKMSPINLASNSSLPLCVRRAILEAYRNIEVPPCAQTFGDEHHLLGITAEKILVTAGFPSVQNAKIDRVGIRSLFSEVHIDVVRDDGSHIGKQAIFKDVMDKRRLTPRQIMVVGDNPYTELGAGKCLGMVTVQTLRPNIVRWSEAEYHIKSFEELPEIIGALGAMSRRRACTPA
jgi:putative hydrolase of the HAD superfamily